MRNNICCSIWKVFNLFRSYLPTIENVYICNILFSSCLFHLLFYSPCFSFIFSLVVINLNAIIPVTVGVIISTIHNLAILLYFIIAPELCNMKGSEKCPSIRFLVTSVFQISGIRTAPHQITNWSHSLSDIYNFNCCLVIYMGSDPSLHQISVVWGYILEP